MTTTATLGTLAHATSARYGEWRSASPKPSANGDGNGIRFDVSSASLAA